MSMGSLWSSEAIAYADFLDTIKQTLNMDEFTTISEKTRLYTEYAETIDRLIEAYEDDRAKISNRLRAAFFDELDGSKEDWNVNNQPKRYINFAKEGWESLAGSVRIEYEPYVYSTAIIWRFDFVLTSKIQESSRYGQSSMKNWSRQNAMP